MSTQYTIKYDGWESSFEDFGEDFVYFKGTAYPNDQPDKRFPILLSFKMILKQAMDMFPGVADILHQAKKHIKGWGPHESVLVRELEELGVDLDAVVLKTIATKINLDKELQRITATHTSPDKMLDIMKELEKAVSEIKSETITHNSICELLEKVITDKVVDRFPEILNSSSDCILQLQTILENRIPALAADLTKLIHDAGEKN